MCRVQERQLSLHYIVISPEAEIHRHISVRFITLIPLDIIFGRNEEEDQ